MRIADLRSAICRSLGFVARSPRRESAGLLPEGFSLDPSPVHRTLFRRRATLSPAVPTRGTLPAEAGRPYRCAPRLCGRAALSMHPSPAVPTRGTLPAEAGRPCRSRTTALWTGSAFDAPHRPPFPRKELLPLKQAVHTAARHDSVDGLRFRCTPSPAVPTRGALPAEAGRPYRCAPRLCGRAPLSMHPIARRSHTRNPRR